eukprot:scaffold2857_cov121-Isochrysis_galbana.AAC.9
MWPSRCDAATRRQACLPHNADQFPGGCSGGGASRDGGGALGRAQSSERLHAGTRVYRGAPRRPHQARRTAAMSVRLAGHDLTSTRLRLHRSSPRRTLAAATSTRKLRRRLTGRLPC